jgi:hypothetical protein
MYLYTETHVTLVFLLGILNGIMAAFIVHELRSGYRITKILLRIALKPIMRQLERDSGVKRKVPAAATASTLSHQA